MNLKYLPLFLLFFFALTDLAGQTAEYANIDRIALAVPDSAEVSAAKLAGYFTSRLTGSRDLLRAFYTWSANEIDYDVANMYNPGPPRDPKTLVSQTLASRKAVCQGYAELFHSLCNLTGIESYLVQGYTRQYGKIMPLSHTWILAVVDSSWYFFDPTWGSGYVAEEKFTRRFINDWFMVKPEVMIKSHMPFDPMYQCLWLPWTNSDFYNEKSSASGQVVRFSYPDTIRAYRSLPRRDQFASSLRRVEANGVINNNISVYAGILRKNVEIEDQNREVILRNEVGNIFNTAVIRFNAASNAFNTYINYYNKQFKPRRPDDQMMAMLDTVAGSLAACREILDKVIPREESLKQNKAQLTQVMGDLQRRLDEQYVFLRRYLATPESLRINLFKN